MATHELNVGNETLVRMNTDENEIKEMKDNSFSSDAIKEILQKDMLENTFVTEVIEPMYLGAKEEQSSLRELVQIYDTKGSLNPVNDGQVQFTTSIMFSCSEMGFIYRNQRNVGDWHNFTTCNVVLGEKLRNGGEAMDKIQEPLPQFTRRAIYEIYTSMNGLSYVEQDISVFGNDPKCVNIQWNDVNSLEVFFKLEFLPDVFVKGLLNRYYRDIVKNKIDDVDILDFTIKSLHGEISTMYFCKPLSFAVCLDSNTMPGSITFIPTMAHFTDLGANLEFLRALLDGTKMSSFYGNERNILFNKMVGHLDNRLLVGKHLHTLLGWVKRNNETLTDLARKGHVKLG